MLLTIVLALGSGRRSACGGGDAGCGGGSGRACGGGETTPPADTRARGAERSPRSRRSRSRRRAADARIGFSAALVGRRTRPTTSPLLNGMEFAAEQINAAGGPVTVEIVSKDNKGDQTLTLTTAQELLDDGVNIQVMTTADAGPAVGQLVSQAGGIISVGGNTAPAIVRDGGERVFAFVFGDNGQASAGAEYACEQGYTDGLPARLARDPVHEGHAAFFADAFSNICGGDDRRRGHVQDRPDRVRHAGDEDPERRPAAGRHLLADLRAGLGSVPEAAALGRRDDPRCSRPTATTRRCSSTRAVARSTALVYSTHGFAGAGRRDRDVHRPTSPRRRVARPSRTRSRRSAATTSTRSSRRRRRPARPSRTRSSTAILGLKDVPLLTGTMTMDPDDAHPDQGGHARQDGGDGVHAPRKPSSRATSRRPDSWPMSFLRVEDLVVRYGPIVAVREVSLRVEQGEIVALLGANGAGKSSFLNAVAGLVPGGRRPGRLPRRRAPAAPAGADRPPRPRAHARGAPRLPAPHRRRQPAARRRAAARPGGRRRGTRAGLRALPDPARAARAGRPGRSRAASSRCSRSGAR